MRPETHSAAACQVRAHSETFFRARVAQEFVPEQRLSSLKASKHGGPRRWFRLYSQLHTKVARELPALERAYAELSSRVTRESRPVADHEIVHKWRALQDSAATVRSRMAGAEAEKERLEGELLRCEDALEERREALRREEDERRQHARDRLDAKKNNIEQRAGWYRVYNDRDSRMQLNIEDLLGKAVRSGIRLRPEAGSIGPLDALGMLKIVLCAMLGELVGEKTGALALKEATNTAWREFEWSTTTSYAPNTLCYRHRCLLFPHAKAVGYSDKDFKRRFLDGAQLTLLGVFGCVGMTQRRTNRSGRCTRRWSG